MGLVKTKELVGATKDSQILSMLGVIGSSSLQDRIRAGYGSCGFPGGCPCRGYAERYDGSNICRTCGHHYGDHW